jgi:non-specific serine/threonine protein kinase
MGYHWAAGSTLFDLGRLARDRGEVAEAAARFREALELARSVDDPWVTARALVRLADIALAWDQPVPATRLLAAAAALDEVMGGTTFPFERLLEEQTRAIARATLGDEAFAATWAAGRALGMDAAIAEALALAPPADGFVAVGLAGASPAVPTDVPAPRDPFGLTRREREVLELLAQRYTDPEIAQALFISPRTASGHVANLFGKMGVSSRRQAAAVAARLDLV